MREQLVQYVNLLFAGAPDSDDIRQEILQNTLDRYDDLISQGKTPEAAYRLAISGIGDVNELLSNFSPTSAQANVLSKPIYDEAEEKKNKKVRGVAIAMYILCAIPLIILSEFGYDILGLCLTLALVATATYLMIITKSNDDDEEEAIEDIQPKSPKSELKKSIDKLIFAIGLVVYFAISFSTGAWYITWVIFPIIACIEGLANAIIDLKEVNSNER